MQMCHRRGGAAVGFQPPDADDKSGTFVPTEEWSCCMQIAETLRNGLSVCLSVWPRFLGICIT